MTFGRSKTHEYDPLTPSARKAAAGGAYSTLTPLDHPRKNEPEKVEQPEPVVFPREHLPPVEPEVEGVPRSEKKAKRKEKDRKLLTDDRWLVRNGHFTTYVGLFLFSVMVLFRPYEIVPGLGFLTATTFYFAIVTMAIYLPSQVVTEGNLTMLTTEVKAILLMTLIALALIPVARDGALAWEAFNEPYIKAVAIFIVLINVVRTRKRLMGIMWLSLGIGIYLSFQTMQLYMAGKFAIEGYRVEVSEVQGIFGNPNEMALHFVMMIPLLITLGLASKSFAFRAIYFCSAVLFVSANVVTFSRGGFLGLLAASLVLAWKLGRRNRLNVSIAFAAIAGTVIVAAPGNYGLRILSIFIPALDPVGSADARRETLITSLIVTARNPWGIGIGNSSMFGSHNHETHNAYTQVSSELGLLGLAAYLVFIISPFKKLSAIERELFEKQQTDWFYYLSIGLQASIIGYMVSSFFASVAYNWFIYYLIAYAVAFRRVYSIEKNTDEDAANSAALEWRPVEAR